MNNNTNSRMNVFLIAVALLFTVTMTTTTVSMLPAANAEDDDDGDEKTDGNTQQVKEEASGVMADCDKNYDKTIFICAAITPICKTGATCIWGDMDPTLVALPISWR